MSIFDPFTNRAQQAAANAQISGINQGLGQAVPQLYQGIGALTTNYGQALEPWQNLYGTGTQGLDVYGNAVGLGGPQGTARAIQRFQQTPGYDFTFRQGNAAITAADAASGKTGSGNEALALAKFNQGLAGTGWQNYLSSLQPYFNLAGQSAGGLSGTYQDLGRQIAGQYGNLASMYYGADASKGAAQANAELGSLTGSANLWNLGTNLVGGFLGSGAGKNLFGGFGGGGSGGSYNPSQFTQSGLYLGSDAKLKEDIEPVGRLADGQTVYRYRYRGDPRTQIGLIAQEVERHAPESVIEVFPDLRAVNYLDATNRAAELMRMAA